MSELEKLFVQIFERKDWIIEHVQQQADSYTQLLASRLLNDGITPPPWLLSPNFNSQSSNPNELKKEDIISKILHRPLRDPTRFSTGGHSLYYRPVVAGGNVTKPLSTEMCNETDAPNKDINSTNEPILTFESQNNDTVGILDDAPEVDDNAKSPQNETDAIITNIYAASDMSLARIQRSKSRQKARELRTSGKTTVKSCLSNENTTRISFSGDSLSKKDNHQVIQDKCPSDMSKWNHVSGATSMAKEGNGEKGNDGSHRLAKSVTSCDIPRLENENTKIGSCSNKGELVDDIMVDPTRDSLQQSCHVNGVMSEKTQGKESQKSDFCGRITRSRSSRQQTNGINKLSELHKPVSCYLKGEGAPSHSAGDLKHEVNTSNKFSEHTKTGSCSNKRKLDGGVMVEPRCDSLQQSCNVNGVMSEKTQGTQSQKRDFCGRTTRSRSSRQQTNEVNKLSEPHKPVYCNLKGEGAPSHSAADVLHEVNTSNKLSDAVKTSQVISDINANAKAQAICSNEGEESSFVANHQENAEIDVGNGPIDESVALQPVNSDANLDYVTVCMESEGLELQKSSECCVNFKPKQLNFDENDECEVNEIYSSLSKKRKLDGLGNENYPSKESASSKDHKLRSIEQQLPKENVVSNRPENVSAHSYNNFDEFAKDGMKNIDLEMNENTVMEDVEHNSKCSQHDDADVNCEVNLSPKEVDNKLDEEMHSEKSDLKADQATSLNMQTNEDDSGQKFKESTAGVHIPESNTKSSSTSSSTKQRNDGFEDCLNTDVNEPEVDLDSSKSKKSDVGTNDKLHNMKLNSANANTCPLNQQKYVEVQSTCFSDSRNFRVHIQRNTVRYDLETPENSLNLSKESASMVSSEQMHKRVHDEMMICDLLEGTEPLNDIQASEEIVTDVADDVTLKQSEPTFALNMIKNAVDDSTYSLEADVGPGNLTDNADVVIVDNDPTYSLEPDVGPANLTDNGDVAVTDNDFTYSLDADVGPANSTIDFDVAVTDNNNLEMNLHEWVSSYGSDLSSLNEDKITVGSDEITPVYERFITDEDFGNLNMRNNEGGVDFDTLEIASTTIARASIIEQMCKSASMQTPFQQHQDEGLYGFMTDGILDHMVDQTSDTGITEIDYVFPQYQKFDYATVSSTPFNWQSKNHFSSPVRKIWERSGSSSGSSGICLDSNPDLKCFPIEEDPISNEENDNSDEMHDDDVENENPVDDVAVELTEVSTKHENSVSKSFMNYPDRFSSNSVSVEVSMPMTRDKVKYKPKIQHGIKVSRYAENRSSSIASTKAKVSVNSNNKSSMRSGIPRVSQKDGTRNNIVSNITSFIPIVQQKQAAAVCTGKRDVKVKALEAAEAARRVEQEKEKERKLKKEAMKIERARIEKENAKERELNFKKHEEDLKKKEADMAARKRQRQKEEEERKQLAKKRKLLAAETQKIQKLKIEKSRLGKFNAGNMKKSENADENIIKKQETGLRIDKTLPNVVQQVTSVPESRDASNDCGVKDKVTSVHEMSPVKVIPVELTGQENSYDISPYQCSDDEDDDDEDDRPTKKFVPSWASVKRVAMVLPLQQKLNPESIFPVDSFCSMGEVLLPRRLQAK